MQVVVNRRQSKMAPSITPRVPTIRYLLDSFDSQLSLTLIVQAPHLRKSHATPSGPPNESVEHVTTAGFSPSHQQMVSSACAPRSRSTPLSPFAGAKRQPEALGQLKRAPSVYSTLMHSPTAPEPRSSFTRLSAGNARRLWLTHRYAPERSACSIMALASATDSASGFSHNTWIPRASKGIAISEWSHGGVAMMAASMSSQTCS